MMYTFYKDGRLLALFKLLDTHPPPLLGVVYFTALLGMSLPK